MRIRLLTFLALGGWTATAFAAGGSPHVDVKFAEPEKFTDVRHDSTSTGYDAGYLSELVTFLERQAPARVAPNGRLTITFTDIDLAGEFEPWHEGRWADVRIVKTLYPARLHFRFVLTDPSGAVIRSGERELSDLSFTRLPGLAPDRLRFEKGLLDDWLSQEFPKPRT